MMAKDKGDRIEHKGLRESEDKYRTIFETMPIRLPPKTSSLSYDAACIAR
ncbi:MAG: hypothetical protein KKB35_04685 [Proteobacteria bacterium]|nr:hypothetical protein [Pseudomonadota bacterium]